MPKLKVDLIVDDKGSIRVANFGKETQQAMELGNKHTKVLAGTMGGLTTTISTLGAGVAALGIGAGIKKSIDEFKTFQTSWTDMAKVTDRDLKDIRTEISALPPEIGNATELMKGYYQTISAGVTDPAESLQFLTGASRAAKAAHVDQAEVIKGLSKTMAGFQGQIESVTKASDLMFAIEKEGQTTFSELVPIIGEVSNASYQMSVSSDEMGASLALITQTAGSTSQAATQYRAVLMGLFKPQEKMTKLMGDMGYTSGQAMVEQLGFAGALKKVKEEADRTGVPIGKLFESSEALMGVAALSANNFTTYETKLKSIGAAAGGTDRAFSAWENTFEAVEEKFYNTIRNVAIEFGEKLAPKMQEGIEDFGDYVMENKDEILDFFTSLATAMGGVATAATWLGEKVGWIPSWAGDMGAAMGLVAGGQLNVSDVAAIGSPAELHKLIADFDAGGNTWAANDLNLGKLDAQIKEAQWQLGQSKLSEQRFKDNPIENWLGGLLHDQSPEEKARQRSLELEAQIAQLERKKSSYETAVVQDEAAKAYQNTVKPSPATHNAVPNVSQETAPALYNSQQAKDLWDAHQMGATDSFMGMPAAEKRAEVYLLAEEQRLKAMEQSTAKIYTSLGYEAKGYYKYKLELIESEASAMKKAGTDELLVAKWQANEIKKIDKEQVEAEKDARYDALLANNDYVEGVLYGFEQIGDKQNDFFNEGIALADTAAYGMRNALSDGLFDALKGDLQDFDHYWDTFFDGLLSTLTDTVAQMAVSWGIDALGGATGWWDSGAWDVKKDHVAVVHAGEMIIPADVAQAVRNLSSGSGGNNYGLGQDWAASPGSAFGAELATAGVQGTLKSYGLQLAQGLSMMSAGTIDAERFTQGALNPGLMIGSIMAGGVPAMGRQALGLSGNWANYGQIAAQVATSLMAGLGGIPGAALAGLVGVGGAWVGDLLGDAFDARSMEPMRDYLEDKLGRTEAGRYYQRVGNMFATSGGNADSGWGDYSSGGVGDYGSDFGGGYGGYAHGGLDYVPKETTYLLDKGERVVSPNQNKDLTAFLSAISSGSSPNASGSNAHIHLHVDGNEIANVVIDQLDHNGQLIESIRGASN